MHINKRSMYSLFVELLLQIICTCTYFPIRSLFFSMNHRSHLYFGIIRSLRSGWFFISVYHLNFSLVYIDKCIHNLLMYDYKLFIS